DSAEAERGGDPIIERQRRSVPSPREPLRAVGRDRVGGREARRGQSSANKAPPTPDPSPPLTAFAGGGEPREPSRGEKETRERSKEQRGLTVAVLPALAYPARIAKSRGAGGAFLLANGRGANLDPASALPREPFLAVAEIAGTAAQGRILLAAR